VRPILLGFQVTFYGGGVNSEATAKTWEKTKLQNLVRQKDGRYYARLRRNGKEIWKSLKTSHYSVAEAKLTEELKAHRELKAKVIDPGDAKIKFSQLLPFTCNDWRQGDDQGENSGLLEGDLHCCREELAGPHGTEVRKITPAMCREWAAPQARATSGNCYNNAISLLRHVFGVAKGRGAIYSNPAE
jgi:hypothetical protein